MKNVALGMSGGVDSSVAAYLLKKQGYKVTGIYLQMTDKENVDQSLIDAQRVSEQLGIEFRHFDIRDQFKEKVISYFKDSYLNSITPNPCIVCNREIKFKLFFELIKDLDFDYISTGHYVKILQDEESSLYYLGKAEDEKKDQTYFLYYLNQDILSKVIFPLGNYKKEDVKKIANEIGLNVAQKKESQEICFIADNDYKKYLRKAFGERTFNKGPVIDMDGNIIGEHLGLPFYTIGQRKGLGISLEYPAYVVGWDQNKNILQIGKNEDLFSDRLIAGEINKLDGNPFEEDLEYDIKIRYSVKTSKGKVKNLRDNKIEVHFTEAQRAITPGQSVVIYKKDRLIGGGVIQSSR